MEIGSKKIVESPSSVLFVCGMNSIRSPMAEFLTRKYFGQQIFCQSAGVHAGTLDGFMQQVMAERDVDMSNHQPSTLEDLEDNYFDLIITLSPEAHHRSLDWANSQSVDVEYWPTMDPSTVAGSRQQVVDAYRSTRDGIENRIKDRFSFQ